MTLENYAEAEFFFLLKFMIFFWVALGWEVNFKCYYSVSSLNLWVHICTFIRGKGPAVKTSVSKRRLLTDRSKSEASSWAILHHPLPIHAMLGMYWAKMNCRVIHDSVVRLCSISNRIFNTIYSRHLTLSMRDTWTLVTMVTDVAVDSVYRRLRFGSCEALQAFNGLPRKYTRCFFVEWRITANY